MGWHNDALPPQSLFPSILCILAHGGLMNLVLQIIYIFGPLTNFPLLNVGEVEAWPIQDAPPSHHIYAYYNAHTLTYMHNWKDACLHGGGTWSSLPPQPWGHGHVLFCETNATHAFTHLLITFTRVHFVGLQQKEERSTQRIMAPTSMVEDMFMRPLKNLCWVCLMVTMLSIL